MTTRNEEREELRQRIRSEWRQILATWKGEAPRKVGGKVTYICPICGNGSGKDGDGIGENPKSRTGTGLKCFKCGFSGDIVALYQEATGADHNTALQELAGRIGAASEILSADKKKNSSLEAPKKAKSATGSGTESHEEPAADFSSYFDLCFRRLDEDEGEAAKEYLKERGIKPFTAGRLHVGFDPFADPANAPGAMTDDDSRKRHTAPRLIFPTNKRHYVARRIDGVKEFEKMNPAGSVPGVFGWRQIQQHKPYLFICEGVFDALSVLEAGAPAVAINSTSNTRTFLELLEQNPTPETVFVICLDNDDAGQRAAGELEQGLAALNLRSIRADICNGAKDPNEALNKDTTAFYLAVSEAKEAADAIREAPAEDPEPEEPPRMTGAEMLDSFLEATQSRQYEPIPTGITPLDKALQGGFVRQMLVTLGAAPGMGKTALAQWILEHMAEAGHTVLYINLEMSREQLLARSISRIAYTKQRANIGALEVLRGYAWSEKQRETVRAAAEYYKQHIADRFTYETPEGGAGLPEILEAMNAEAERAAKEDRPAPLVCIDYLQIIDFGRQEAAEGIKSALRAFKAYAIENNTMVLLIVANNRASNASGAAELESGRDTSALEYSGDIVLGLTYTAIDDREKYIIQERNKSEKTYVYDLERIRHERREAYDNGRPVPEVCRRLSLKVNKNRFGEQGRAAKLVFDGKHNTFTEPAAFTVSEEQEPPEEWRAYKD